jgi:hypothetical protein
MLFDEKKTKGQKSHDTVPLNQCFLEKYGNKKHVLKFNILQHI